MVSEEEFAEMNEEARELYGQAVLLFDSHSSGAIMMVLAQLCAHWLAADNQVDHNDKVRMFNDIIVTTYADLLQTETSH